ncbi:MAG: PhnD/SsuA/transferrin family substrate-binding protein [Streptosporangiales bacterium]|nr:PhnD/SsuA/transferrin family substrate-binding protein [Streptosporangiales bacterium]
MPSSKEYAMRRSALPRVGLVRGVAVVLGLTLVLAGCGGGKDAETGPITYGGSTWLGHYPAMVAVEQGFFEKAGVDVDFKSFDTSSARMTAVASGDVDFASTGAVSALSLMASGDDSFVLIGSQDKYLRQEGLVAQRSVKTMADLRGKRIGVPFSSSSHVILLDMLDKAGLDPKKDVKLVNMDGTDMVQPFRSGQIDAATVWQPSFAELRKLPGAHVLGYDTDTSFFKQYGFAPGPDVLVMRKEFVEDQPERARKVADAYFQGLDWLKADAKRAVPVLTGYTKLEAKEQQDYLADVTWLGKDDQVKFMAADGEFVKSLDDLAALMARHKLIGQAPKVGDWVNTDVYSGG